MTSFSRRGASMMIAAVATACSPAATFNRLTPKDKEGRLLAKGESYGPHRATNSTSMVRARRRRSRSPGSRSSMAAPGSAASAGFITGSAGPWPRKAMASP